MEELEQQSKQIKTNSEQLENLCADKFTHYYAEKRKSRKVYQEQHSSIATKFANVSQLFAD